MNPEEEGSTGVRGSERTLHRGCGRGGLVSRNFIHCGSVAARYISNGVFWYKVS